jgi:mannosyl-oligosaccharide alpha-1,2-mannosidase
MLRRKQPTTTAPRSATTKTTTSARRERLFIFLLGSIASLMFLNLHEKHETSVTAALSSSSSSDDDERLRLRRTKSNNNFKVASIRERLVSTTMTIIGDDDDDDDDDERTRRRSDALPPEKPVVDDDVKTSVEGDSSQRTPPVVGKKSETAPPRGASSSSSFRYYWASNITKDAQKQDEIREAMRASYGAYEKYAFGFDELQPKSLRGSNNQGGVSASVIDAIDTLKIMNLEEEYERARAHILNDKTSGIENLASARLDRGISVFETNIRVLGGLLSVYDLTLDENFLERAVQVANAIAPAFETKSGIPYTMINPLTKRGECFSFYQNSAVLADAGTLQLEFFTLADRTKNRKWYEYAKKAMDVILSYKPISPNSISTPLGLYPLFINPSTGKFTSDHSYAIGALGDSFYEYLIKAWRAFPNAQKRSRYRVEFDNSMDSVLKFMVSKFPKLTWQGTSKQLYDAWFLNDLKDGRQILKMDHLVCFISGALVLGAEHASEEEIAKEYLALAEHTTTLCRDFYRAQVSGLSPDVVVASSASGTMYGTHNQNIQRPETVEAIFYMYRKTGDEKYRNWAWEIFQSMREMYATDTGWTGIRDVRNKASTSPQNRDDITQTFFFAETLKYLYLTFGSSDEIDLSEWVFNTEAHPVKVSREFEFSF